MTVENRRPRRPSRRRRVRRGRALVGLAAALAVFALGVALGEALHQSGGGGSVTYDRTVTIPPERRTVTVTATSG
jgi:ferric-dicitrate binding protein FerR (iron transport regulator)